jgi:hypothetical protein
MRDAGYGKWRVDLCVYVLCHFQFPFWAVQAHRGKISIRDNEQLAGYKWGYYFSYYPKVGPAIQQQNSTGREG